jgi:hypothetical protein
MTFGAHAGDLKATPAAERPKREADNSLPYTSEEYNTSTPSKRCHDTAIRHKRKYIVIFDVHTAIYYRTSATDTEYK